MLRTSLRWFCVWIGAFFISTSAFSDAYPNRPVRIIVPNAPGGIEIYLRIVLPRLQDILGQPVVIESRPGASGAIGAEAVARAEPDGYTLLFCTSAQIVTAPLLKKSVPYNPIKDFTPISKLYQPIEGVQVNMALPIRSVVELVDYAKANPGKLTFASSGIGSVPHISGELLKVTAGIDLLHVPYNGIAQIVPEITAGRIDVAFLDLGAAQRVEANVRNLAILDPERSSLAPDLPSIRETFPGFRRAQIWFGLFGPAGLPQDVIDTWHRALGQALAQEEAQAFFRKALLQVVVSTPREFEASIQADRATTAEVISRIGLSTD